ncbi:zinc finger protein 385C-like isoform X1 [Gadus macrocephalus]|uniref:zinc finger protein 385C-like isoform X1 n=1 Tax=Gadus macrocephalus TaxID=80720 RepID=UPI0028CB3728|nr:zinc finger protein 385C-like isoform X1 [Gadus macrocephalus]
MKYPKSPGCPDNSLPPRTHEEDEDEEGEDRELVAGRRAKRERRQGNGSATPCQVCNIQLNSWAQAQIHYRGKTHQRRLRRLSKAANTGGLTRGQPHPLLASLALPGRTLPTQTPPQLSLKHFLPLRVNGSTGPLHLFPNFSTMDPVQKAVINHTFGVAPPKKKSIISCNICHLRFNSMNQAEAHYKGHKHARKLKALVGQRGPQRSRQRAGPTPLAPGRDRQKERGRAEGVAVLRDTQRTDETSLIVATMSPDSPRQQTEPTQANVLPLILVSPSADTTPTSPGLPPQVPNQTCSPPPDTLMSKALVVYTGALLPGPLLPAPPLLPLQTSDPTPPAQGSSPLGRQEEPQEKEVKDEGETMVEEEGKGSKRSRNKLQLHCPLCKVTVNSNSQLEAHCLGSRHKQMLDGQSGGGTQLQRRVKVTSSARPASRPKSWAGFKTRAGPVPTGQPFHCELCQLSVNSESQLKQHMSSRRHKERVSGKPSKPKFTPYAKVQPSTLLATKLALQKHLSKALPPGFLHNPFNPAALCTLASGPLALRGPHGPTAFFQGPLISPTLFRPAPGPLRATHTPIIFSPY